MTIDIEKLASESGGTKQLGGWYLNRESLTQFAAKVLEDKEREIERLGLLKVKELDALNDELCNEIAELKAKLKHETSRKHINALQAHINDLREALELVDEHCKIHSIRLSGNVQSAMKQALSKTPAQSLIEHDNEVIERCAKVVDESYAFDSDGFSKAIRALKVSND